MILKDIIKARKHSNKTIAEMKSMHDSGMSYRAIGRAFKLSGGTIYSLLHRWANMYKPVETLPKGYIRLDEYCMINNLNYNTIYGRIKHIKSIKYHNMIYIPIDTIITNKKFISDNKIQELYSFYENGLKTISQLSKATGLARDTVRYYIKENYGN